MGGAGARPAPNRPSTGSSFLDDWLQKKETNNFKTPSSPFSAPAQTPTATPVVSADSQSQAPVLSAPPASVGTTQQPYVQQMAPEPTVAHPQQQTQQVVPTEMPAVDQSEGIIHDNDAQNADEMTIQIR